MEYMVLDLNTNKIIASEMDKDEIIKYAIRRDLDIESRFVVYRTEVAYDVESELIELQSDPNYPEIVAKANEFYEPTVWYPEDD